MQRSEEISSERNQCMSKELKEGQCGWNTVSHGEKDVRWFLKCRLGRLHRALNKTQSKEFRFYSKSWEVMKGI